MIQHGTIFTGDNLPIMRGMERASVDLIYLDPPFNSNRNYAAPIGSKAAGAEFKDTWTLDDTDDAWWGELAEAHPTLYKVIDAAGAAGGKGDKAYCIYMAVRLLEMHRILKSTGSLYLHCDQTMSHSVKLLLDAIFAKKNFRNEIVWCYKGAESATGRFPAKHDVIFYYRKDKGSVFNMQFSPHSVAQLARYNVVKEDGSRWANMKGKMRKLGQGRRVRDWWEINMLSNNAKERTGYPTQKPLELLRRIIKASSNPGDMVLDPFCGCATACLAAEAEGRKWVGIDISPKAYELINMRLKKELGELLFKVIHRTDIPIRKDAVQRSKDIKHILFGRQEGLCAGCRESFQYRNFEVDHIVASNQGGSDDDSNLQLLCGWCHVQKRMGKKGIKSMAHLIAELTREGIR